MSRLRIFNDDAPQAPLLDISDRAEMAAELTRIGVGIEEPPRAFERGSQVPGIAEGEVGRHLRAELQPDHPGPVRQAQRAQDRLHRRGRLRYLCHQ